MKFGDKYELLDSLTTGGVETFVANDKVRGERVLVHILHCDPQRANQPTVQWVLESFRRVAPEPAGLVLETGRYSGTLYAYVVTKLPEDAALRTWVQQYKAQARDTQEVPAPPAVPTPESLAPTAEDTPPPPPPPPLSSVTQLLREFEPQAKPGAPVAPPRPTVQPPQPPPSFGTSADRSGVRMAAPSTWNAETPRIPAAPKAEPPRSSPPDPFPPNFLDKNFPAEASAPPVKDSPKLGEFTSFFQGPFRGDRPSETPQISAPPEPPRKTVGDFTAMFGTVKPQPPEEPLPAKGIAGNESAGTGFTGWFNPNADIPSRTSSAPSGPIKQPTGLPRAGADPAPMFPDPPRPDPPKADPPRQSFVPPPPISYVAPAPPIFPAPTPAIPPMPIFSMPNLPTVTPSALPSDGATHAFSQPGSEPTPAAPLPQVGPSAYTQIISVRPPSAAADAAGAPKDTPPAFAALSLPKLPPPPPLPKAPKLEIPPPVSYWPLVLTLTVSFAVAVLLVLYFWLRH
jgi:hypothetical protein